MNSRFLLLIVIGVLCLNGIFVTIPSIDAHEQLPDFQNEFITIEDTSFNKQSLKVGEILKIQGTLINQIRNDQEMWITISTETPHLVKEWKIIETEPSGNSFSIPGYTATDYSLSAKALKAGEYHVHMQLTVANIGPILSQGKTIIVEENSSIPYFGIEYYHIIWIVALIVLVVFSGREKEKTRQF